MSAVRKIEAPAGDLPTAMTANFMQVAQGIDTSMLLTQVLAQPQLWNKNPCRLSKRGPHHETQDMFLRYRDETPFLQSGDWSTFTEEHIATWNQTIDYLPAARPLIFGLMSHVMGEVLGGVFLYKIEPGKQIYPHVDSGWHPNFFDKFNVCLASNERTRFCYKDDSFLQAPGDIHWFKNTVPHWVINHGATDHIVMTVCIGIDRGARAPWSPEGWSRDGVQSVREH